MSALLTLDEKQNLSNRRLPMATIEELAKEIDLLKERNQRVEREKAWETSSTRALSIVVLTYTVMTIVMYVIGITRFYVDSIIPTLGFFLSTQSLPIVKRWWMARQK
jgi:hypothetical protein